MRALNLRGFFNIPNHAKFKFKSLCASKDAWKFFCDHSWLAPSFYKFINSFFCVHRTDDAQEQGTKNISGRDAKKTKLPPHLAK